jgi:hypothetical protein
MIRIIDTNAASGPHDVLAMTLGGFLKSILDPTFCYIPSIHTDISKTFARIRREQHNGTRTLTEPGDHAGKNISPIMCRMAKNAR